MGFLSIRALDVQGFLYRGLFHLSRKRHVLGVTIGVFPGTTARVDAAATRLHDALKILEGFAPERFRRVTRRLPTILVISIPMVAQYHHQPRLCLVDDDRLLQGELGELNALRLASVLVHEATHAWLLASGIPYTDSNRMRVERICLRAESLFAARLPPLAREHLSALLALYDGHAKDIWSPESSKAATLKRMEDMRMPSWFIRFVARTTRG